MPDDAKSTLTPKLRFPEFRKRAGWKFAPLSAVLREKGLKSDGKSEVHSVSLTKGVVPQIEHMGRSFSAADTSHYTLVRPFDVVYTRSPLAIFKLGIVKQHRGPHNAIVSPLYGVFSPINRYVGQLIEVYFDSPARSLRYLEPLCQKGAKNTIQISNDRFLSGEVFLPDDEAEQQKIADCLTSLDQGIAAQGRKVAALAAHKEGLMQQLFPREGETLPRLRFPEFRNAGEWTVATLDQLVDIQSGATPSKANIDFWNGSIPWISAKDMKRFFLNDSEDHISDWAVKDGARIVPEGTLLILTRGMTLLKDVPICVVRREVTFNQDVKGLRPKAGTHGVFLAFLLTAVKNRLLSMVNVAGHGTGKLDTDGLRELNLTMPKSGEQERIADCLLALDTQLSAESDKLDALKTHKNSLSQRLFPTL